MQKLTITHEEISPGITPLNNVIKNVPLTRALWIGDIIKGDIVSNVEHVKDVISRTFFDEFGIKSVIGCPLKLNEKVIGMVLLQWVNDVGVFADDSVAKLTEQCKSMATLLKTIS